MSSIASGVTKVHIIVHGRMNLIDKVKDLRAERGFDTEKMHLANLEKAGSKGEYVAMLWPPWNPKEIILSEITEKAISSSQETQTETSMAMGAWVTVGQKELYRIQL
jgi:hypothetical protein